MSYNLNDDFFHRPHIWKIFRMFKTNWANMLTVIRVLVLDMRYYAKFKYIVCSLSYSVYVSLSLCAIFLLQDEKSGKTELVSKNFYQW